MNKLKDAFAILLLISLCAYTTWQKQQTIAVVSLILLLGVLYKSQARKVRDLFLELLKGTSKAKVGSLELQLEQKLQDYSKIIATKSIWSQILLSKLDSEHIGLLLTIQKEGTFKIQGTVKNKLRDLRSHGLLTHDKATMEESSEVQLTKTGKELAEFLSAPELKIDTDHNSH
ncbi:MAG: hypothetical protein Roseis2KO_49800 [Roseivirga sp.]